MTREWGTKMVGLGVLSWRLPDDDLDSAFLMAGILSGVDAVGGVMSRRLNATEDGIGPILSGATSALSSPDCASTPAPSDPPASDRA